MIILGTGPIWMSRKLKSFTGMFSAKAFLKRAASVAVKFGCCRIMISAIPVAGKWKVVISIKL